MSWLDLTLPGKSHTLKAWDLSTKMSEIDEANKSLTRYNDELERKTSDLMQANKDLFESNHELAQLNKRLAETNKEFASTNRRFARLNIELAEVNKELEKAYVTIDKQNKTHTEFLNVAAHELRTPIMPILGTAELLKTEIEADASGDNNNNNADLEWKKHQVEVIIRNAERLETLANSILDVTRIEGQLLVLNYVKFDLIELISDIIKEYNRNQITKTNKILLEFRGHDSDIIVKADKDKIAQVMSNLLNNAFKFTMKKQTEKANIWVNCQRRDNDMAVVSVEDDGVGIDSDIMPRLFTKFTTSKSSLGGTGLGLFISKSIVEAHGGRIWAENRAYGNGAAFYFTIPLEI
jgi:signal transduction histidine kinase